MAENEEKSAETPSATPDKGKTETIVPEYRNKDKKPGIGTNIMVVVLVFITVWLITSNVLGGATAAANAMPFSERCPEQSKELLETIKASGTGEPTEFYPIGNEKATSSQYIRADLACGMQYALYPATQTPEEARDALERNGWVVDESAPGAFAASKETGSGTYTISYPDGGFVEGKTALTVRLTQN